jgi:hypothetical protein
MSPLVNGVKKDSNYSKQYASKSQKSRLSYSSDEDARPNKKLNKTDINFIRRKKSYD